MRDDATPGRLAGVAVRAVVQAARTITGPRDAVVVVVVVVRSERFTR